MTTLSFKRIQMVKIKKSRWWIKILQMIGVHSYWQRQNSDLTSRSIKFYRKIALRQEMFHQKMLISKLYEQHFRSKNNISYLAEAEIVLDQLKKIKDCLEKDSDRIGLQKIKPIIVFCTGLIKEMRSRSFQY